MTPREHLLATHQLFSAPNTWIKGAYHARKGEDGQVFSPQEEVPFGSCHCLTGGLAYVAEVSAKKLNIRHSEVIEILAEAIGSPQDAKLVNKWKALVDWNDDPARTKQEVLDLLWNTAQGLPNG